MSRKCYFGISTFNTRPIEPSNFFWLRFGCILFVLCMVARGSEPIQLEEDEKPQLPVADSLIQAGLDPKLARDIQSDLASKAFSDAEQKLLVQTKADTPYAHALLETLGGIFFIDAKYLQSAIAFKKAEKYSALSESARFTLAMSYIELKRANWARDELLRLINDKPRYVLYRYWLGRLEYNDQKFAACIASFNTAIELNDHFVRAYTGRGLCEEAIGLNTSAEQSYKRANILNREQKDHSAWAPINYGTMLARLGRYAEATPLLEEALEIDPSSAKAHYELGRVEEQTSHSEMAIQDFAAAANLDPSDPSPVYALFRLYKASGKRELAATMIARFRVLNEQSRASR